MSTIDRDKVRAIAHLSRLELDDAALDAMTKHMQSMLAFVAELDRHDRREVSARMHGGEGDAPLLRPDEPRPSLSVDEALGGAPDKGPGGFRVPAILDRGES